MNPKFTIISIGILLVGAISLLAKGKPQCGAIHHRCRDSATHDKGTCNKEKHHNGQHKCGKCGANF